MAVNIANTFSLLSFLSYSYKMNIFFLVRLQSSECHFLGKSKMFLNDFQINKQFIVIKKVTSFFKSLKNETGIININPRRNFISLCFLDK